MRKFTKASFLALCLTANCAFTQQVSRERSHRASRTGLEVEGHGNPAKRQGRLGSDDS